MIHIIEMTELVTSLSKHNDENHFAITFEKLREIGYELEKENQSVRVNLSDSSRQLLMSRNKGNIKIEGDRIIVDNTSHPMFKHLMKMYCLSEKLEKEIVSVLSSKEWK